MKLIYAILILLFALNSVGQEINFNTPLLQPDYAIKRDSIKNDQFLLKYFNFTEQYNLNFYDQQIQKNLDFLSLQMSNESIMNTNFKRNSERFLYHCGPLEDGLYLKEKGEDKMLSSLFDYAINELIISRLFRNKN